ncbi:MAG: hypothetical protein HOV79_05435 [Hamadaea sp.]|nr:hypothetical protein [Hamadaea sp.]
MRVGFGSAVLAVPRGTPMGGYAFREGRSGDTLDELRITAISWHDGVRRAVLALADVICVNSDLTRAVRAAVPDAALLWLAASHTHAGPDTGCVPGGTATPPQWLHRVTDGVVAAVAQAVSAETEARGQAYNGVLTGVGTVRSQAADPATVPLDVIEVCAGPGRVGVIVVLPVHPTVLPAESLLVSADLTGAVRRALAGRLGDGTWVAVATGAAGDISSRHTRRAQDPAELDRLGALVADRCLELLSGPATGGWSQSSVLTWQSQTVHLRPKPPVDGGALVAAAADTVRTATDPVAAAIARGNLHGARWAAAVGLPETDIEAEVAALRIGDLTLAALPGEPFLGPSEQLRPATVLGYANAYPGYLPPAAAYGTQAYEVLAAAVAPGGGEEILRVAAELIDTLGER